MKVKHQDEKDVVAVWSPLPIKDPVEMTNGLQELQKKEIGC